MFPFLGYPDLLIRVSDVINSVLRFSLPEQPIPNETMDTVINTFIPFARKSGRTGGILGETVKCGGFMGAWKSYDFLIYQVVVCMAVGRHYGLTVLLAVSGGNVP